MGHISRGFTLIELLVTLVVVGILASLGMPAFSGAFERARADTDMRNLMGALNLARLEAINRGIDVTVSPDGGTWAGALKVTTVGGTLRKLPGMAPSSSVNATSNASTIVFNSLGGMETPATDVTFSYDRNGTARTISVCMTGRIHTGANCQ